MNATTSTSAASAAFDTCLVPLGRSGLHVTPICLGTMTFGEQVDKASAHAILDRALERGVNFIDTAEMYAVPARAETCGATETILGHWLASRPGARQRVVLATKVAGPARGMAWIRGGAADLRAQDIVDACDASLRRLQTDVIDLYQIHWPNRNVPSFGALYFDPARETENTAIDEQLRALQRLVTAGKVRAIGLSNESPWGVMSFLKAAEQAGLPRIATIQNPYSLVNRVVDNGLDEVLWREQVSLLAYSPLGFGTLSGKYDEAGFDSARPELGRLARFDSMRKQRWARPETLAAARRYNALARDHGLSPVQLALAFCMRNWRVASTIIGVTSLAQLDECLGAWPVTLDEALLTALDRVRWDIRDPGQ
jgi:aryl-alcohol dehydrogenase-like predicted oxidoreductase